MKISLYCGITKFSFINFHYQNDLFVYQSLHVAVITNSLNILASTNNVFTLNSLSVKY